MTIVATAFLATAGYARHDACRLEQCGSGWRIEGTAVFRRKEGPACIAYRVECGADWKTVRGDVRGFLGRRPIEYLIVRQGTEWTLNGEVVHGLDHLVDLDLGFTPATNLQQLRRVPIAQGCAAHISVAWLDAETGELTELDQRYTRPWRICLLVRGTERQLRRPPQTRAGWLHSALSYSLEGGTVA